MSELKVNKISPRSGTTLTLGDSGDTLTIPSGAKLSGVGTVSWQTTVKTAGFTAASGEGYFVNTTSGGITVNLPAGSAGDIVAFKDYANTWDSNAVTVTPNGSDKIGGSNANATLNTESQSVTLIFVDSTKGWLDIQDSTSDIQGAAFVAACGGNTTATVCTNFKVHTFTGPGTFTVTNAGNSAGSNTVDYLVVGGGGAGGASGNFAHETGGGGAGGYRESPGTASGGYSVSPLGAAPAVALPVSVQAYPIVVGGGGVGSGTNTSRYPGIASSFSTISSAGGGGGGTGHNPQGLSAGGAGGSGGGSSYFPGGGTGGAGNTPPVSPPQGQPGGGGNSGGPSTKGGGGGGATQAGKSHPAGSGGGIGATSSITGSAVNRAGGGDGGNGSGCAGPYGGGPGAGTVNTGGGGKGTTSAPPSAGSNGGSGIVILRYKFQ